MACRMRIRSLGVLFKASNPLGYYILINLGLLDQMILNQIQINSKKQT